jgi:hypothetical protein
MFNTKNRHVILRTVQSNFGDNKKADALCAFRRICCTCQQQVDDVIRHVVVTICDKLLGAINQIVSIFLLCCAGGDITYGTSGLRLCQTHGAGPFAAKHFFAIIVFLFF